MIMINVLCTEVLYISNYLLFKHYSEESNLKQKSERLDRMREKVSQDMVVYGLYHTPFNKWADGDYDV